MNLERTVIALGFFDGVHRGHGALLQKTVQRAGELGAIPAVFTFDRPPKEVVTGRPMPLINSPEDRADLARRIYGIQQVILAPFDEAMMTMPWQDFITELLVKRHGAVHLVAGHDYHFGYKNQGDPRLLQEKCRELGMGNEALHDFMIRKAKLGLNDGCSFGRSLNGFMRLNAACPRATLEQAMRQLEAAVNSL